MNILMLHNRYLLPGGEEHSTAADAALLGDYGHRVELLEQDNRDIERLGKARTALGAIWAADSFRRIRDKLRDGSFDILHVQNFFPLWSPSVYYAAARCGVPVVQTLHNYRLMCVNSVFFREHHACEDCLGAAVPWRGVLRGCYRSSRAASAVVAGMIGVHKLTGAWTRKVQAYIAVSEFARQKYIAGGLPAEKIVTRPNFLHPSPAPGAGGGGYALFVGRLSEEKGLATLLEAWRSARPAMPLKIVGDGPLSDMVKSGREPSRIEFMGGRTLEDVLELMGRAECLVFPSEWPEPMGRTIMEAFAVGTPVLAARMGAPATMIEEGKTGFFFTAGDVSSLRQRVEWCSANVPELRALRKNARSQFEKFYTGVVAAESLLAVYSAARERLAAERNLLKTGH